MRRAALLAALDAGEFELQGCHFDAALQELVVDGGKLTKSILGFQSGPGD